MDLVIGMLLGFTITVTVETVGIIALCLHIDKFTDK